MTAALIQSDGHVQPLCGLAHAEPACIAALANAVQAAGAELVLRLGAGEEQGITLNGSQLGISLYPAPGGALLLLVYPSGMPANAVAEWSRELLAQASVPAPAQAKPRVSGLVSLSDALNVSEP